MSQSVRATCNPLPLFSMFFNKPYFCFHLPDYSINYGLIHRQLPLSKMQHRQGPNYAVAEQRKTLRGRKHIYKNCATTLYWPD